MTILGRKFDEVLRMFLMKFKEKLTFLMLDGLTSTNLRTIRHGEGKDDHQRRPGVGAGAGRVGGSGRWQLQRRRRHGEADGDCELL